MQFTRLFEQSSFFPARATHRPLFVTFHQDNLLASDDGLRGERCSIIHQHIADEELGCLLFLLESDKKSFARKICPLLWSSLSLSFFFSSSLKCDQRETLFSSDKHSNYWTESFGKLVTHYKDIISTIFFSLDCSEAVATNSMRQKIKSDRVCDVTRVCMSTIKYAQISLPLSTLTQHCRWLSSNLSLDPWLHVKVSLRPLNPAD